MDFREVIIELLGIQGVVIEDVKRSRKKLSLEIKVRQKRSECFCSKCGLEFARVKEWSLKKLKAPPMGIYQTVTIRFMQMRGLCEACQATSVAEVEWIHPKFESMTCGFAEVAGRLMEETTCEATARILNTESKLMWDLDQHRMEVMLQFLKLPDDLDVSYLAPTKFISERWRTKIAKVFSLKDGSQSLSLTSWRHLPAKCFLTLTAEGPTPLKWL